MTRTRTIRVTAPHLCAGATWESVDGGPARCVEAAPILAWMRGQSLPEVLAYLRRKGWQYEWLPEEVAA